MSVITNSAQHCSLLTSTAHTDETGNIFVYSQHPLSSKIWLRPRHFSCMHWSRVGWVFHLVHFQFCKEIKPIKGTPCRQTSSSVFLEKGLKFQPIRSKKTPIIMRETTVFPERCFIDGLFT